LEEFPSLGFPNKDFPIWTSNHQRTIGKEASRPRTWTQNELKTSLSRERGEGEGEGEGGREGGRGRGRGRVEDYKNKKI
jgi:hypothetical protein